jgi:hypothetical protein
MEGSTILIDATDNKKSLKYEVSGLEASRRWISKNDRGCHTCSVMADYHLSVDVNYM